MQAWGLPRPSRQLSTASSGSGAAAEELLPAAPHAGRLQQPLGGDVAVLQRLRGQQRRGGAQRLLQATAAHVACHLLHHCSMGCQGGGVG